MCVHGTMGTIRAGQYDKEYDYKRQSNKLRCRENTYIMLCETNYIKRRKQFQMFLADLSQNKSYCHINLPYPKSD